MDKARDSASITASSSLVPLSPCLDEFRFFKLRIPWHTGFLAHLAKLNNREASQHLPIRIPRMGPSAGLHRAIRCHLVALRNKYGFHH